jgi:hypothetical protein
MLASHHRRQGFEGDRVSEQEPRRVERLTEAQATALAEQAVDAVGGAMMIYRSPRHPFSMEPTRTIEVDGHPVEVRWGEISSPAVVSVAGYVFEIVETGIELLIRPPRPRSP